MKKPLENLILTTEIICSVSNFVSRFSKNLSLLDSELHDLLNDLYGSLIPNSKIFFISRVSGNSLAWDIRFLEDDSAILEFRTFLENAKNQRDFFAHQAVSTDLDFDVKELSSEMLGLNNISVVFVPIIMDKVLVILLPKLSDIRENTIVRNLITEVQILIKILFSEFDKNLHKDLATFEKQSNITPKTRDLTERQSLIYQLICSGLTNRAIGRKLGFSEVLIKTEVSQIYKKLGITGRKDLYKF